MDGDEPDVSLVEAVHHAFPQARLMVRAYDRRSVMDLSDAPVCSVVREVYESAIEMARRTMQVLDLDESEILHAEETYRSVDRKRLDAQSEAGDLRAAKEIMITRPRET